MGRYRCSLGKYYKTPKNQDDVKKACKEAVKEGVLLLKYEDCNDDWERQFWKNKARELYGE